MTMQNFPILNGQLRWIPWELIGPHEEQALSNHGQTLKRLAERGGLCPSEAVAVLENRSWHPMSDMEANAELLPKLTGQ